MQTCFPPQRAPTHEDALIAYAAIYATLNRCPVTLNTQFANFTSITVEWRCGVKTVLIYTNCKLFIGSAIAPPEFQMRIWLGARGISTFT